MRIAGKMVLKGGSMEVFCCTKAQWSGEKGLRRDGEKKKKERLQKITSALEFS